MSCAEVAPGRGAIVRKVSFRGRDVLCMDEESFSDASKNVRGGIPLLFPFASSLKGGILEATGTQMPQHGFARNAAWTVQSQTANSVVMGLKPDEATGAMYPFDWELQAAVDVDHDSVVIGLGMINRGRVPLPAAPGWHPYFVCPRDRKHEVRVNLPGFDHSRLVNDAEFSFGVPIEMESPVVEISLPTVGTIALMFSGEMKHLQFWSQPGRDFVCIEPFWGPPNTINTSARLEVAPGKVKGLFMGIELVSLSPNGFSDAATEE
ncbi:hypothetical protein IT570_09805 [Candidatus Sumerlaeota bacterium]|nr:hypothetical protein [Candidatus Sumerlaeota bacterium]